MVFIILKDFGGGKVNKKFLTKIKKLGKTEIYSFKFDLTKKTKFELKDLSFKKVAEDIYSKYRKYDKLFLIGIEHTSPYALYFVDMFPKKCSGVICFPLRGYTKESLTRRIWKYKDQKGWDKYITKKYNIEDYFLKVNNKRLQEIISKRNNKEEGMILMLIIDLSLRKQYNKIPKKFKVPTYLFTRLDLSAKDIIKINFMNKSLADMKGYKTEKDTLIGSCMWNFAKVKYDDDLIKKNKNNTNLRIQYFAGMDNKNVDYYQDLLDRIKLMIN